MGHWEVSNLDPEDVVEILVVLHYWLGDLGHAINLPDPVVSTCKTRIKMPTSQGWYEDYMR